MSAMGQKQPFKYQQILACEQLVSAVKQPLASDAYYATLRAIYLV